MTLSRSLRFAATLALVSAAASSSFAGSAEDVARAAALVQRMVELNQQFSAYDVSLTAPEPLAGAKGKYLLPVDANGTLTGWAEKSLNAQVGNIAGEQAGSAAAKGLGSIVPGGGLAGGFLKKKGKESGAMLALGGTEYVKSTSSLSFDSPEAYAVYLHSKLGQSADYSKAVQAAIALYPDLEKSYSTSVQSAYDAAMKVAATNKAAAEALAAKEKAAADSAAAEAAKIAAAAASGTTTTTTTVTTTTVTVTPTALSAEAIAPVVTPVAAAAAGATTP
ncbi:MAG: hypothetical protein H7067_12020 [Burkholderiales bacterium]|nr:hypothetical protein [Opitutaceae bacterium]